MAHIRRPGTAFQLGPGSALGEHAGGGSAGDAGSGGVEALRRQVAELKLRNQYLQEQVCVARDVRMAPHMSECMASSVALHCPRALVDARNRGGCGAHLRGV